MQLTTVGYTSFPAISVKNVQNAVSALGKEIGQCACSIFLAVKMADQFKKPRSLSAKCFSKIVISSVAEELLFRGLVQEIILPVGFYCYKTYIKKVELTEEDVKTQRVYSIYMTAALFSAVHLLNPLSKTQKLLQCTFSFVAGVIYGRLEENYKTLSLPILAHSINNFVFCLQLTAAVSGPVALGLVIANGWVFHFIATGSLLPSL